MKIIIQPVLHALRKRYYKGIKKEAELQSAEVARELFLDGYYKAIALGDGNCRKCAKCNPEGCNFPGQMVSFMEACGMDVFVAVRNS